MPTYNTIMSVSVGTGLLTLLWLVRELRRRRVERFEGWALALAVPGVILFAAGLHMTLTWPLAKYFPFDNIVFGETSLAFGTILLAVASYLWFRGQRTADVPNQRAVLLEVARPLSIFFVGVGLSLIAIMFAGLVFQLFAAPPEEPISGSFAQWPWLEATFMSVLIGLTGVASALTPVALASFAARDRASVTETVWGWLMGVTGLIYLVFGALNFFTHIGLIINTMPSG